MKNFLTLCCASLLALCNIKAQNSIIIQSPNVDVEYQITHISPNGKWACGNINDGYYRGFRWNLTTNELRELSLQGETSIAFNVSNDGTVVGNFMDDEYLSNGASIEAGGYWKDGSWHHLDSSNLGVPSDDVSASQLQAISPNGKWVAGIAVKGTSNYIPVVWNLETGEMTEYLCDNPDGKISAGSILSISDDGKACGWIYRRKNNRTPCIWTSPTDTILPAYEKIGPYCVAGYITADGSKVLAYDRVYNINTRTAEKVLDINNYFSFELFSMCSNGTVLGYVQENMNDSQEGVLIKDGVVTKLSDLLAEKNVDMSKYPQIIQTIGASDDEKTFGLMAYDTLDIPRSVIVKLDQNTLTPAPVALQAVPLNGIGAVRLTWKAPLTNVENVKGYDIYRNGTKINSSLLTELSYIDQNLSNGSYSYTVKAEYDSNNSEDSESANATLSPLHINAPSNLVAVQRGLNNVRLVWDAPTPAIPSFTYTDSVATIYSIGGGEYSMEVGINLPKSLLAAYSAKGQKLSDVCFYPMSKQSQWKINLYTVGTDTTLVYTQTVDGTTLTSGVKNCVHLTTPYTFTSDKDLIVAVEADVDNESYSVFGFNWGICIPRSTDLMRQVGEDSFYSAYDRMLEDEDGAMMYELTWAIEPMFSDDASSQSTTVKNYNIYVNNTNQLQSTTLDAVLNSQEEGEYTYGVSAVAANGDESTQATAQLTVSQNTDVYKPFNVQVTSNKLAMNATWQQPVDDSRTILTYSSDNCSGGTVGSFMAKALYGHEITRTLNGYQIKAFRFYPLADADFTFYLEEDGERVAEVAVENYTLNQWNEILLDTPITLNSNSEYGLILDSYDVADDAAPLGQDDQRAYEGESDLYSTDEGETFSSLASDGGTNANWMMGMVLGTSESTDLHVKGYNVKIDGKQANEDLLTETSYQQTFTDETATQHTLQVQALYSEPTVKVYNSSIVYFTINPLTAIDEIKANEAIQISQEATHLQISGVKVQKLSLYAANGSLAAESSTQSVAINNLPHGVYVLVVRTTDGKEYSQKVRL